VALFQDLIRGNVEKSVEDAAIVAPVMENEHVEDRVMENEHVEDQAQTIRVKKTRPLSRKLPEHDLGNIMPTGKRLRKPLATIEPVLVAPVAPKTRGLAKEKKSAKDKELEKSDRKQEIMVCLIFFCRHLAVK
jgi:hypothetical protein